jgi:glycosyltransferase involved in cell wall biosynthesis
MTSPRVSAFLTTYNAGRYVRDALEGIRVQTFKDYEVVVADDGSTDETLEIVREFSDLDPNVITGPNLGLPRNWARALPHCKGEILAFTAGDDRWLPNNLQVGLDALDRNPDCALAYARVEPIDDQSRVMVPPVTSKKWQPPSGWVDPLQLLAWNYVGGHAALVRREVVERLGGVDPDLLLVELDLFVRISRAYPIVYSDVVTAQYRQHDLGMSRDLEGLLRARLAMYDKHLKGEPDPVRRRMVSRARTKIAYRELWPSPTAENVTYARRNLLRAMGTSPAAALNPLNLAMLGASLLGRWYVKAVQRLYPAFADSKLKLRLQRVLGIAR